MIDTHCHLNFDAYDEDRDQVVTRAQTAGVRQVIIPAIDRETSPTVIEIARRYEGVYAAVGVHPNSTASAQPEDIEALRHLAQNEAKVIAIGEIGLDYYWDKSPNPVQHAMLEAQLTVAAELQLPVILHNRESSDDLMAILESWVAGLTSPLKDRPGVLHSFSAPPEIAERALALGFYLGFTGPVTFKKARVLRRIIHDIVPLDRMLVETDGPFLAPEPYRGKRNEPAYIPLIVERLAELKHVSTEEMARSTTMNAARLFNQDWES